MGRWKPVSPALRVSRPQSAQQSEAADPDVTGLCEAAGLLPSVPSGQPFSQMHSHQGPDLPSPSHNPASGL